MKTIKQLTIVGVTFFFLGIAISTNSIASSSQDTTVTGAVEQVWEDGFRLNTGERTIRVDSWNVYGDNTPDNVAVGDRLTITREFDDGEFNADSISD
ncbi:conserved exported hypothetical protein [Hyella patelloides LEGE 07179]|uniref:DUF5666 domain-containing protein n=1 Tax=Hyella patelloides LEGE 07179 TaxID=945734 RepID=A0A563VS16_9CYAN|nr:hypothetical protein [Hyella patelloides]VEP14079.1 conserved exported hypothetical protein [Hyella patelloides LEGE 07179]